MATLPFPQYGGDCLKPIRSVYSVVQKRVVEDYYTIEATSKADALRKFEENKYEYDYETYGVNEYTPSATHMYDIHPCPNKGEGWSDIPLDELKDMKIGSFGWHYNGRCKGERTSENTHCHVCRGAMQSGKRLLTLEEKRYLKNQYGECRQLNTEE